MDDFDLSPRHFLFGFAAFGATVYTLAIPRPLSENTAFAIVQTIGAFMLVFGVSVLLRVAYIRYVRRDWDVSLWSPWLTVIGFVVAVAAATAAH